MNLRDGDHIEEDLLDVTSGGRNSKKNKERSTLRLSRENYFETVSRIDSPILKRSRIITQFGFDCKHEPLKLTEANEIHESKEAGMLLSIFTKVLDEFDFTPLLGASVNRCEEEVDQRERRIMTRDSSSSSLLNLSILSQNDLNRELNMRSSSLIPVSRPVPISMPLLSSFSPAVVSDDEEGSVITVNTSLCDHQEVHSTHTQILTMNISTLLYIHAYTHILSLSQTQTPTHTHNTRRILGTT